MKNVYEEEKKWGTWNYLNLAFVWYKESCRSRRLLLRLYSICIILHIIHSLFNNNWIFINNQNRVLKMLGVASNAFNGCVCRACFRPVVLFHTYDQKENRCIESILICFIINNILLLFYYVWWVYFDLRGGLICSICL